MSDGHLLLAVATFAVAFYLLFTPPSAAGHCRSCGRKVAENERECDGCWSDRQW